MNNKRFLLVMAFLTMMLILSTSMTSQVLADGFDAVVEATGDDAANCERLDLPGVFVTQDVCNVQAAVNAHPGGKILLKGTFHFAEYGEDGFVVPGTDGTIFITNDITIRGEKRGDNFLTTIKGGYFTFSIGYSPIAWAYHLSDEVFSSAANAVPVNAAIGDIAFENSLYMPLRIWASTGATIKGNRIIDGRSLSIEDFFGPGGHAAGFGIVALPPAGFFENNPQLIRGSIHIKDNFIDGQYRRAVSDDPWAAPSYSIPVRGLAQVGIWVALYKANVSIKDNEVYNMGIGGILSGGNDGFTEVKDNLVNIITDDPEIQPHSQGIRADGGYFYWSYETAKYVIKNNVVTVGGNPEATGIYVNVAMNAPAVKDNEITLVAPAAVAIRLWNVTNADVTDNNIDGEGRNGVALGHHLYPLWLGNDGNTLSDNNLDNFSATIADYYLSDGVTNNRLFVNEHDFVLNESNNDTNMFSYED